MMKSIKSVKDYIKKLNKNGLRDIFISSIFSELISFIVFVFIVRIFSKEEYGYYAIAYNIYGYVAVFIGLGLNNGVLQYCSEKRNEEQKNAIYQFTLKVGNIFNFVLLFIMPIFSIIALQGDARIYFILMSGWPITAYLSNYYLMRLRVVKDNHSFMISNVISSVAYIALAAILSYFMGIIGYVISYYFKFISSFVISAFFVNRQKNIDRVENLSKKFKNEILKYSVVCCLTNFVSQILLLVDVTCINIFIKDPSVIATYKAATQIPIALLFIPSSIVLFAFPYLAEHNSDLEWLKSNSKKLIAGVFLVNFIVSIVIIVFAPFIVIVLWGERYADAASVLRILTLNFLITGSFNMVFGNIMVAIKKVNINLIKTIVCSVLNIVLDIFLINYFGSIGASYATLIVSVCSSSFAVLYFVYWLRKQQTATINNLED